MAEHVVGRPTKYTKKLADQICEQLAMGRSMRSVAEDKSMPAMSTLFKWLREKPAFSQQYTRAKEESADAMAEELLDISDNGSNDWMERHYKDDTVWVTNGEALQRSKLRVDTRKFLMAKMKPKRYGDHLQLDTEQTVVHKYEELNDEQLEAAIKAREDRISKTP